MKGSLSPPQLTIPIVAGHTFRFLANTAGSAQLTKSSFGDLLCLAATATSAYQLGSAFKIRKIEMWGPPTSTFTPNTVSCEFNSASGTTVGPSRVFSDTSVGATRVAHIVAKPAKESTASFWQNLSGTDQVCLLYYGDKTIIDIHYSIVLRESAGVSAVTGAVVGATVGQLYLRPLDSVTGGSNLAPVSYVSI